jgi:hypothetical protein
MKGKKSCVAVTVSFHNLEMFASLDPGDAGSTALLRGGTAQGHSYKDTAFFSLSEQGRINNLNHALEERI